MITEKNVARGQRNRVLVPVKLTRVEWAVVIANLQPTSTDYLGALVSGLKVDIAQQASLAEVDLSQGPTKLVEVAAK